MTLSGRCSCGKVRYSVNGEPLVTQACHCLDCQRTTGSAFVVHTTVVESDLEYVGETRIGIGPTGTGAGSELHRCDDCGVILWVRYRINRVGVLAIRAGTLDDPAAVEPAAHIFVRHKAPWLTLPDDVPLFEEGGNRSIVWSQESNDRFDALPRIAS